MKQSTQPPPSRDAAERLARAIGWFAIALWWLCLRAYTSRSIFLLQYTAFGNVAPKLEPLAPAEPLSLLASASIALVALVLLEWSIRNRSIVSPATQRELLVRLITGNVFIILACLPWMVDLLLHLNVDQAITTTGGLWGPGLWQPLWWSLFTGLAAGQWTHTWWQLCQAKSSTKHRNGNSKQEATKPNTMQTGANRQGHRWSILAVSCASLLAGVWWFAQSYQAFYDLQLGFNDCGHFAQRIASTAAGHGWLIESPVLPAFWDHFNPGITLLVPLWIAWPHMTLFMAVQAVCLAGSGLLVMRLALSLGASHWAAMLWSMVWLLHPVTGQMNLAYTYGWHPISLAIPLLLIMLIMVVERRWILAVTAAVLASSMEEGVLVVIATTATTWALLKSSPDGLRASGPPTSTSRWLGVALVATISFIAIYRFSGLAEFQTGRFHTLGHSALEILLSPIQKPAAFWGLVLRSRNAIFICGVLIPWGITALFAGWKQLLPLLLPVGVLIMWDHLPAQSLAFHYPSILMPTLALSAIVGSRATTSPAKNSDDPRQHELAHAAVAAATALAAGFLLGQLPWSMRTLDDVHARTYYSDSSWHREPGAEDLLFIRQQLSTIQPANLSILSTGRIATHLVGARELETVGQFQERRARYQELTPDRDPLMRYDFILLDRLESFQQLPDQTESIRKAAIALGFEVQVDQYEFTILKNVAKRK